MGDLYANGEGVRKSNELAIRWYKKAIKHKDDIAKKSLEALEKRAATHASGD